VVCVVGGSTAGTVDVYWLVYAGAGCGATCGVSGAGVG
jgi:hypothetical protein